VSDRPLVARRPAESASAATATAVVIAYALGLRDPGVIVSLAVVIGAVPGAVTWLVNLLRR
jgi:energy-converting hydrogenase Eha subunit B